MAQSPTLSRRTLITAAAGITLARGATAQAPPPPAAQTGTPASTITSPPRDWTLGRPSIYPDPDVLVIDP
jgi:hypothetical protein